MDQLLADIYQVDANLDRSVELLRADINQVDAKLDRLNTKVYHLNGKTNRLIGHAFGFDTQIEDDEEEMKQLSVES